VPILWMFDFDTWVVSFCFSKNRIFIYPANMKKKLQPGNKQNIFDLIEGYYMANLLIYLSGKGAFAEKEAAGTKRAFHEKGAAGTKGAFPEKEAAGAKGAFGAGEFSGLSKKDAGILQILYDRTDIVVKKKNGFALNPAYAAYPGMEFHIDKFLKAYGRFDSSGGSPRIEIDAAAFARAFEKVQAWHSYENIIAILSALKARTILDLGAGPGRLVELFCKAAPDNRAFGIDLNKHLCSHANLRLKRMGLGSRVKLKYGSVMDFDTLLSEAAIRSIDVVTGSNIFNEFFEEEKKLVGLLKRLRKTFAGKYLVVMDYYGVLNTRKADDKKFQHSYVHDLVQLFSGQGVPPENYQGWNKYYVLAKCSLMHVYEGTSDGINWFVHIVRLG
jgi:SAM-dependent methyltransferase